MKLDGIEKEVIMINPYRQAKSDIIYPQSLQKESSSNLNNQKNLLQENSDNFGKITMSQEELNRIMDEIKHKFSMLEKYLKIDIDAELKMPISKIIDMRTEEVIRQIPPEWLVDILKRMEELKGVFYYEEV
ncbi:MULTISPECIES: flagellar protein FlaG [Thermodesulfovibrio]|jgi:flagellar protein FlaG|uniref:FlaG protein n=1 Tax=Thermodesulfovibrio yellowstonii (strain ATCC 51303 / DSM 11347 / YP87) TaxID=289376 RepID=B5YGB0_THEYD|nr:MULTISPECIES: flagellar protein FlaG [Thermodesulfovibrio]ACI21307.1 FlaG protein [Thermodesulfovibrio yellowstonii DSM 11347]